MVPLLMWFTGLDQRRASSPPPRRDRAHGHRGLDHLCGHTGGRTGSPPRSSRPADRRFVPRHAPAAQACRLAGCAGCSSALLVLIAVRLFLEFPSSSTEIALNPGASPAWWHSAFSMGIASGLFGIGGGVLAVPIMITLFGSGELLAKGTSLLAMIPTSITGTVQNTRHKLVDLKDAAIAGLAATAASVRRGRGRVPDRPARLDRAVRDPAAAGLGAADRAGDPRITPRSPERATA